MDGFDSAWLQAEEHGLCDALMGVQYHRIWEEWNRFAARAAALAFIITEANRPAPAPERKSEKKSGQ